MHSEITNSGITSPKDGAASQAVGAHTQPGPGPIRYGLPCANCRLYYAAELAVCPICGGRDRTSPVNGFVRPTSTL